MIRDGVGEMIMQGHVHLESLRTDVPVLCLDAVALCKGRLHVSIWFYIRISNRRIAMKLNTDPVASKLPPLAMARGAFRQERKLAIPRILHMKLSAASNFIEAPPQTECNYCLAIGRSPGTSAPPIACEDVVRIRSGWWYELSRPAPDHMS